MTLRLIFLVSLVLWAAVYLLTLTDVHTYDALSYILDVERKPWLELFHPHHLAYGPLGAVVSGLAAGLGWTGGAERPLQVMNALAGALGAALFAALAGRMLPQTPRTAGALAGLLLGASYAYWYFAIEVEVYTIAAVLLVVALWLMLLLARRPTPGLAVALGVIQGLAVLFHQTNVLLSLPALVALGLGLHASGQPGLGQRSVRLLAAYGLPLALIVAVAYLGVGLGLSGLWSWGELSGWAAGYATTGFWGGPLDFARLPLLGRGLADTFAQPGGAWVGLLLLAVLLLRWRGLRTAPRGLVALGLSWLLVYGAFFVWWEPDNVEFWIASLPPFYLLVLGAVFGGAGRDSFAAGSQHASNKRDLGANPGLNLQGRAEGQAMSAWWGARLQANWAPLLLLLCGVWMLVANAVTIRARGDAERDLQRVLAVALAAASTPGDLLVLPDGLPELYLPFYAGREQVISLNQAVAVVGSDWPLACALIQGRIDAALASGYAVSIADAALRPLPSPPGQPPTPAERLGLSAETVAACYADYAHALTPLDLGVPGHGYARIAATQELADGPGWDFTRLRWGWQLANAEDLGLVAVGWRLRPGVDPHLISPPLQIETARFAAIELRLATTTAARDAQLFFLDEAGQVDEARSLRWTLAPGSQVQTYRLELRDTPGWAGVVTGLRLDPVGVGDGGLVVVEAIRLLP
jgi:hypothetical protein